MSRVCFYLDSFLELEFVFFLMDVAQVLAKDGCESRFAFYEPWTRRLAGVRSRGFRADDLKFDRAPQVGCPSFTPAEVEDIFSFAHLPPADEVEQRRRMRRAEVIAWNLGKYLTELQPDLIVASHGYPPVQKILNRTAAHLGLPVILIENGYSPGTLQVGKRGVNANNLWLTKLEDPEVWEEFRTGIQPSDPLGQTPGRKRLGLKSLLFLATFTQKTPGYQSRHPEAMVRILISEVLHRKWRVLHDRRTAGSAPLPRDFYFIPFQVHDDSQIVYHSPLVRNMEQLLQLVYRPIREHDSQAVIVVKEHPLDRGRVDYCELRRKFPDVIFLGDLPALEVIRASKAVITVNSTVGFEALQLFKPVITLGQAFYNVPGIVHHVDSQAQFDSLLEHRGYATVNVDAIKNYLSVITKRFIPCNWRRRDAGGVANLAAFLSLYSRRLCTTKTGNTLGTDYVRGQ